MKPGKVVRVFACIAVLFFQQACCVAKTPGRTAREGKFHSLCESVIKRGGWGDVSLEELAKAGDPQAPALITDCQRAFDLTGRICNAVAQDKFGPQLFNWLWNLITKHDPDPEAWLNAHPEIKQQIRDLFQEVPGLTGSSRSGGHHVNFDVFVARHGEKGPYSLSIGLLGGIDATPCTGWEVRAFECIHSRIVVSECSSGISSGSVAFTDGTYAPLPGEPRPGEYTWVFE